MIKPIQITISQTSPARQSVKQIYCTPKFTLNPNHYIVPIKRYKAGFAINLEVIIPAINSKRAMYLSKEEFECDGWIVDENYEKYKII